MYGSAQCGTDATANRVTYSAFARAAEVMFCHYRRACQAVVVNDVGTQGVSIYEWAR
jgi:hypothetical protein